MATNEDSVNDENGENAPFWQLAKDGIKLLLNNKQREASTLFQSYPQSIQMNAGYAYAVFTDALMTFEDDKLHLALQTLKDLEKKCSSYTGWIRSMRSKVFGSDTNTYAEQLESQIILADCHIFVATITFLQQDISGYIKGGWILRKAYKHYQHAYNEILGLYKEIVGDANIPVPITDVLKETPSAPTPDELLRDPLAPPEPFRETDAKIIEEETKIDEPIPYEDIVLEPPLPGFAEPAVEEREDEYLMIDDEALAILNDTNASTVDTNLEDALDLELDKSAQSFPVEAPVCPTDCLKLPVPSNSKNGYITYNRRSVTVPPSVPKHSISCHTDLSAYAQKANAYVSKASARKGSNRDARNSFLKKSTSLHSALSERQRSSSFAGNLSLSYFTSTFNIFTPRPTERDIDKATISRLLCAVSFGYGLLQLGISLLPPSVLRVTSFLGFGGNRRNGLENLMYARQGDDMRAPFATLALLWYHTIVRPFFALDGNNVQAGVEAAARLINDTKEEFGESALFLFFKGRVERLNSNLPAAIEAFQLSINNASQREIKTMSMHEVGWCYLIRLDFTQSENTFQCLKQSSRWSRSFYSYLCIISAGSNHMFQETERPCNLRGVFQPVPKGTQLDEFLNRRYEVCPIEEQTLKELTCLFWKLLIYELLYLWNTLPSCVREDIEKIIEDCESAVELKVEPMIGLSKLIEGSSHCIMRNYTQGIECFRSCLDVRKSLPTSADGAHISAFAQYELGLLLIKNEQTKIEGKKLLQNTATDYKDYDFEQRLSVRVHAILKTL